MRNRGLIEKHIQNRLNTEEKEQFEQLFNNDDAFKKEVEFHKNLKKVIKANDISEDSQFRSFVNVLEEKANKKKKSIFNNKWLAAASLVLILGLGYFIGFYQTLPNDIYTNYFEPYRNVIQPVERDEKDIDEKAKAFMFYESGNFKQAAVLFTKLYKQTNEPYYLFYKANALMQLNKVDEAIPLLLNYSKSDDLLKDKAYWYLSLAYLKINDSTNAKKYLHKIVDKGFYKSTEAKAILKKLN